MKNRFLFIAIFIIPAFSASAQLPDYLKKPGPKNIDEYSFVFIHIIRENEPGNNMRYGLYINGPFAANISDSSKYTIRYPVMPLTLHFSYAQEKDIQILSTQANGHYYFKAAVVKNEAPKQNAVTSLIQLSSEEGQKEFEEAALRPVSLDHPEQLDVDLILTKKDVKAYSKGRYGSDSVYHLNLAYLFPVWFQNLLKQSTTNYFVYSNLPLSKTYSEFLQLSFVDDRKLDSEEELKEVVEKKFKSGKIFLNKKDELITFEPVSAPVAGHWTAAYYYAMKDFTTPVKGTEPYLELRSIHAIFYTYSEIYKKIIIWDVEYSVRGKQNELWTKEEMLLRLNYFLKGLIQRIE
jgi:hypothetical protein